MRILARNKKASFEYEVGKTYDAGIVLAGYEAKAAKMDYIRITEAICSLRHQELWIYNMHIPLYSKAHPRHATDYSPTHERKLLVHKKELARIYSATHKSGQTIIPLLVYEAVNRRIKLRIGIGKRKKKVEKKQIIKERDTRRSMHKSIKQLGL